MTPVRSALDIHVLPGLVDLLAVAGDGAGLLDEPLLAADGLQVSIADIGVVVAVTDEHAVGQEVQARLAGTQCGAPRHWWPDAVAP